VDQLASEDDVVDLADALREVRRGGIEDITMLNAVTLDGDGGCSVCVRLGQLNA
jgi:hypothetical protein